MLSPGLLSCVLSVLMEGFVLMLNSFDCHHLVAYRGRAAFVMPILCTERQEFRMNFNVEECVLSKSFFLPSLTEIELMKSPIKLGIACIDKMVLR